MLIHFSCSWFIWHRQSQNVININGTESWTAQRSGYDFFFSSLSLIPLRRSFSISFVLNRVLCCRRCRAHSLHTQSRWNYRHSFRECYGDSIDLLSWSQRPKANILCSNWALRISSKQNSKLIRINAVIIIIYNEPEKRCQQLKTSCDCTWFDSTDSLARTEHTSSTVTITDYTKNRTYSRIACILSLSSIIAVFRTEFALLREINSFVSTSVWRMEFRHFPPNENVSCEAENSEFTYVSELAWKTDLAEDKKRFFGVGQMRNRRRLSRSRTRENDRNTIPAGNRTHTDFLFSVYCSGLMIFLAQQRVLASPTSAHPNRSLTQSQQRSSFGEAKRRAKHRNAPKK